MRSLIPLLIVLGLVVGAIPLVTTFIELAFFVPEVEYNGIYEPLRGVEMDTNGRSIDDPFQVRSGSVYDRWSKLLPFVGAVVGAAVGFLLDRLGFQLTRRSRPRPAQT